VTTEVCSSWSQGREKGQRGVEEQQQQAWVRELIDSA
jgi:hypothetical protein